MTGDQPGQPSGPRRVRVTSPRVHAGRPRAHSVTSEIDAQTELGTVYIRSLVRSQLRLAGLVLALLAVVVGGLPLLFVLVPAVRETRLLGVPLPWVLLGAVVYPVLVGLGWFYVRQAERHERAFAELVDS
ncbi:MAG TPA: hypothetical protein VFG88_11475 [Nocardioidaceae bacterium]|nr:hypothetical protein [Nocardioidaceae bacterium]